MLSPSNREAGKQRGDFSPQLWFRIPATDLQSEPQPSSWVRWNSLKYGERWILLHSEDKLIAALDPNGFRPLRRKWVNGAIVEPHLETKPLEVAGWATGDVNPSSRSSDDNGTHDNHTTVTPIGLFARWRHSGFLPAQTQYPRRNGPCSQHVNGWGFNWHVNSNMKQILWSAYLIHHLAAMGFGDNLAYQMKNGLDLKPMSAQSNPFAKPTQESSRVYVRMKLSAVPVPWKANGLRSWLMILSYVGQHRVGLWSYWKKQELHEVHAATCFSLSTHVSWPGFDIQTRMNWSLPIT